MMGNIFDFLNQTGKKSWFVNYTGEKHGMMLAGTAFPWEEVKSHAKKKKKNKKTLQVRSVAACTEVMSQSLTDWPFKEPGHGTFTAATALVEARDLARQRQTGGQTAHTN